MSTTIDSTQLLALTEAWAAHQNVNYSETPLPQWTGWLTDDVETSSAVALGAEWWLPLDELAPPARADRAVVPFLDRAAAEGRLWIGVEPINSTFPDGPSALTCCDPGTGRDFAGITIGRQQVEALIRAWPEQLHRVRPDDEGNESFIWKGWLTTATGPWPWP